MQRSVESLVTHILTIDSQYANSCSQTAVVCYPQTLSPVFVCYSTRPITTLREELPLVRILTLLAHSGHELVIIESGGLVFHFIKILQDYSFVFRADLPN